MSTHTRVGALVLFASGCAPYPEGLRATPDGSGPMITVVGKYLMPYCSEIVLSMSSRTGKVMDVSSTKSATRSRRSLAETRTT